MKHKIIKKSGDEMTERKVSNRERLLKIYEHLNDGKVFYKNEAAAYYGVSLKAIQRDVEELRSFFHNKNADNGAIQNLVYDRRLKGYKMNNPGNQLLSDSEIFAVLKILLESRSLTKAELYPIVDKLINSCLQPAQQKQINELIGNEKYYYIEPHHGKNLLETMWRLSQSVSKQQKIHITYRRMDGKCVERTLEPVGIMFSEFYFYLTAFIAKDERKELHYAIENDPFPTIYRIDRIESFEITNEHFYVPYQNRFEEGLFRRRVQFMQGGTLRRVKFYYKGPSVEAVLDRLPTAVILKQDKNGYLIKAEVFGKGIEMWLRSQGGYIDRVEYS